MGNADIGVIGLGTMGSNLARNLANHDFTTVVYNRTTETMRTFIEEYGNDNLIGEVELTDFVKRLATPRKILILVSAGPAVDAVLNELSPLLEEGDVIVDCGNSNYHDTIARVTKLKAHGLHFLGCGVSGGEEGALNGPSLMPGGSIESWKLLQPMLEGIAAKDFGGKPCVAHLGKDGTGHFVKMVHNGIEYAVMQMMAEAYDLLRLIYGMKSSDIADVFERYNSDKLGSYLFGISTEVLRMPDEFESGFLVDYILDKAAQKGTGQWTAVDGLNRGIPTPSIAEAVMARVVSSHRDLRLTLSTAFDPPERMATISQDEFVTQLGEALYAAMLSAYAQGFHLIQAATEEYGWSLDLSEVARIWQGGCIIRAKLLKTLREVLATKSSSHLFDIPELQATLTESIPHLRETAAYACQNGVPTPALTTSLAYFEGMTSEKTPANFIQGLRDYFGAHTYERTDREGTFHTDWT